MNQKLIDTLIRHEGMKLIVYKDSKGILTIGVGRNLEQRGITEEEALYLLYNDIDDWTEALDKFIPWWKELSDEKQDVLINMCHQLGIQGLLKFKKFLSALQEKDYKKASLEMLDSKWAKEDSPNRAKELSRIIEGLEVR